MLVFIVSILRIFDIVLVDAVAVLFPILTMEFGLAFISSVISVFGYHRICRCVFWSVWVD
jgi:hypothetical protein